MLISNNHAIMGDHRYGRLAAILGWTAAALMAAAAVTSFAVGGGQHPEKVTD
jgi:Mn2+/Fe2+ NRAMP family transporter